MRYKIDKIEIERETHELICQVWDENACKNIVVTLDYLMAYLVDELQPNDIILLLFLQKARGNLKMQ